MYNKKEELSVEEVAQVLDISTTHVLNLIKCHELKAEKNGRDYLIKTKDVKFYQQQIGDSIDRYLRRQTLNIF